MARTMELARRYDIPVYTHIYELRGMALQARLTLPEYSGPLIRRLADEGVLDPRLNLAHSVWLARDEIELLAETGTGVVLNPQGNLKMKCGIPPIRALQDAGVRIGLGCDNCSCSDAQNMFMAMKLFALLAAVSERDAGPAAEPPPRFEPRPRRARTARGSATSSGASRRASRPTSPDRHERPELVAAQQRGAAARARRGRARRAPCHRRRTVVVRDRRLTTIDEDEIYDAVRSGDARLSPRLRGHLRARAAPAALARRGAPAHRLDRNRFRPDLHPVLTFP